MNKFNNLKIFFLLFLIILGAYYNALNGPFMLDDRKVFRDPKIMDLKYIPRIFIFAGKDQEGNNDFFSTATLHYRPLALFFPIVLYHVFGEMTLGYHLVNLLLFCVLTFIIYHFIRKVFHDDNIALISAILFSIHPINSLYINYITATMMIFQGICLMGGLLLMINYFNKGGVVREVLGYVLFVLGLLCHEVAVVYPLYLTLLFMYQRHSLKEFFQKRVYVYWLILGFFLFFRFFNSDLIHGVHALGENAIKYSWVLYFGTFAKLILWYVGQLIYPNNVLFSWGMLLENGGYLSAFIMILMLVIACFAIFRAKQNIKFVVAWMTIGFLPLIVASRHAYAHALVIEPHWLLIASISFFMALGMLLIKFLQHKALKIIGIISFVVLFLSYVLATHYHNYLWSDERRYLQYWSSSIPWLEFSPIDIARYYHDKKDYLKALEYYQLSLGHSKGIDVEALGNMAVIKYLQRNYLESLALIHQAQSINNLEAALYNTEGLIYVALADKENAIKSYTKAIELNPYRAEPYIHLGNLYLQDKSFERAYDLFKNGLKFSQHEQIIMGILRSAFFLKKQDVFKDNIDLIKRLDSQEDLQEIGFMLKELSQ